MSMQRFSITLTDMIAETLTLRHNRCESCFARQAPGLATTGEDNGAEHQPVFRRPAWAFCATFSGLHRFGCVRH